MNNDKKGPNINHTTSLNFIKKIVNELLRFVFKIANMGKFLANKQKHTLFNTYTKTSEYLHTFTGIHRHTSAFRIKHTKSLRHSQR